MPTSSRPLKVFLCHSSQDKPIVRDLCKKLKAEGWIDPWLDEEKLLAGQKWDSAIQKAVKDTDVVIVFLSSNSVTKEGYVQKELHSALNSAEEKPDGTIFIIPLRLDNCDVPFRLNTWQYVDYFPHQHHASAYKSLLRSLKIRGEEIGVISQEQFVRPKRMNHAPGMVIFSVITMLVVGWLLSKYLLNPTSTPAPPSGQVTQSVTSSIPSNALPTEISVATAPATENGPLEGKLGRDGMGLVYIPAGEFMMGGSGDQDERPVHSVILDAYWIDKTEVTNRMYADCVDNGPCREPSANTSLTRQTDGKYYYKNPEYDNYPIIYVSWFDATQYCSWVGRRLPTEAEWEKAASWNDQAKSSRKYPWGEKINCSYANFAYENQLCVGDTKPVGSYPTGASYFGLLDMAGNVWEWVFDRYDPQFYSQEPVFTNPTGPPSGDNMVVRGGSFLRGPEDGIRSADRGFFPPRYTSHNLGFRCAMDAP